jgi:HSP20 family protein
MFSLIPWRKKEGTRTHDNPLSVMRNQFDSLFERFFDRMPFAMEEWEGTNGWGLDVKDDDKEYVVRAEAPGFEAGDFDIQLQGNILSLRAEHKQETGKKDEGDYTFSERRLLRSVTLPAGADAEKIDARYRNGVLELHLPKLPEAQGRRITVKNE